MARATAAERRTYKKSEFGRPSKVKTGPSGKKQTKGAYPVHTKGQAKSAKAYAAKEEREGKLSKSAKEKIDAKANKKLKKR